MKLHQSQKQRTSYKFRNVIFMTSLAVMLTGGLIYLLNSTPRDAFAASGNGSGRCLTFNGSSSAVDFGSVNFGLSSSNTMTIGAWIKWGNKTGIGSWANIASLNSSVTNGDVGQFWLQHDASNTYFEFAVQTTATRKFVTSTTPCVQGNWYYVTGVYDGSAIRLYVNGTLQATTSQTGNISAFSSDYKFMIGKWAYIGRYFSGDIDEVCLWNTALSQTQVRNMMCKKLNGNESGLVGYWRMNETTGSLLVDKSSGSHNGTIFNAARNYSGAPVGDTAVYTFGGSTLTFLNSMGDSLKVNNFSSVPGGIVIYRIDTGPSSLQPPAGFSTIGSAYYYGVFIPGYDTATYKLTYYFNGYPGIADKSQLAMAYRTANNDMNWLNLSATLSLTNNTLSKTALTGRHEFDISSSGLGNTLPVELTGFDARLNANAVKLTWQTASEINNDFFSVERSTDGKHFENIENIGGAGNSTTLHTYSTSDFSPPAGLVYYRIKQTDFDGHAEEFEIKSVKVESTAESDFRIESVFPNPFRDHVTLRLHAADEVQLTVSIISAGGNRVLTKTFDVASGTGNVELTTDEHLPDGLYMLTVSDQEKHQEKFSLIKSGSLAMK